MYAIRSYYARAYGSSKRESTCKKSRKSPRDFTAPALSCRPRPFPEIITHTGNETALPRPFATVITSYSIHYTKLYERIFSDADKLSLTLRLEDGHIHRTASTKSDGNYQIISFATYDINLNVGQQLEQEQTVKKKDKDLSFTELQEGITNATNKQERFRITSYNVCYTKLLRHRDLRPTRPRTPTPGSLPRTAGASGALAG